jgi:hypothetical protein
VGARDPARIARHHAAHVREDLHRLGTERVAERDCGKIAPAAPERGDRTGFAHALEARHDRNDTALE